MCLVIRDIEGLGPEELVRTMADAVGAIEDPTKRTAAAQIAFGGDAAAMLAVLDGGQTTFDQAIEKGKSLGTTTEEEAAAATEMKEKMAELQIRLSGLATDALPVLLAAFEFIADVISRVIEWVGGLVEKFVEFYNYIDGPVGTIIETLVGYFQKFIDFIDGPVGLIFEGLKLYFTIAKTVIETVVSGIVLYIETYIGLVKGAFRIAKTVIEPIIGAIKTVIETAVGVVVGVFTTASSTLKGIINGILALWEGLANGITGVINSIIGAWNGLEFKVPEVSIFGKKFGGWTIGTPNIPTLPNIDIPRLAEGGVITQPTLALVGEAGPEAVVPLNEYEDRRRGNPKPMDVNVHVVLELADGVDELITAKVNRVNNRTSPDDPAFVTRIGEF